MVKFLNMYWEEDGRWWIDVQNPDGTYQRNYYATKEEAYVYYFSIINNYYNIMLNFFLIYFFFSP